MRSGRSRRRVDRRTSGELRLDGSESEIEATVDVQTFSLIVTAEPYYAVTAPSEVVVMENIVREDTRGNTSVNTLQFDIVPRGAYVAAAGATYTLPPPGKKEPPDVQQARNAIKIAQLAQAEKYAASGLATTQQLMSQTEGLIPKGSKRDIISAARATVQSAEATRVQAISGRLQAEEAAARAAAAASEKAAREKAAQETAARAQADQDRQRAEALAKQAAEDRRQAEAARASAESRDGVGPGTGAAGRTGQGRAARNAAQAVQRGPRDTRHASRARRQRRRRALRDRALRAEAGSP